jgi:outer membrane lipoprotein-sorting protein
MTKTASLGFVGSVLLGLLGSPPLASGQPAPPLASTAVPLPKPAPAQRSGTAPSIKPLPPSKSAVDQSASDIPRPPAPIDGPANAPAPNATASIPSGPIGARAKPSSPVGVAAKPAAIARTVEKPPATTGAIEKPPAPGGETTGTLTADQRALLDRISNYLSNVRTLVGKFDQVGPDGNKTTGEFYLQKPGQVRFKYDPPTKTDLVADGQWVAVRDRDLEPPSLYKVSDTPLRFLLADRIDLIRDTNLVGFSTDKDFLTVVIEERSIIAGTHRLALLFGAKDLQLKQWTVTDPQGYDTTIALRNLDATKRPDPDLFKIN